jgi:hypothetical protein
MNRIVREHYPAARLPSDLRDALEPVDEVTVIVKKESVPSHRVLTLEEIFASRKPPYRSAEDIDAEIAKSRDEW